MRSNYRVNEGPKTSTVDEAMLKAVNKARVAIEALEDAMLIAKVNDDPRCANILIPLAHLKEWRDRESRRLGPSEDRKVKRHKTCTEPLLGIG